MSVMGGMHMAVYRNVAHPSATATSLMLGANVEDSTVTDWEIRAVASLHSGARNFYSTHQDLINASENVDNGWAVAFSAHGFNGGATNSGILNESTKVSCLENNSSYMCAPNLDGYTGSIGPYLREHRIYVDTQPIAASAGKSTHDMLQKQLRSVGCPSWVDTKAQTTAKRAYVSCADRGPDMVSVRPIIRAHCKLSKSFYFDGDCICHQAQLGTKAGLLATDHVCKRHPLEFKYFQPKQS